MSEDLLQDYLTPHKILTRRISGADYHFSFMNPAGHRITLISDRGRKKTLIG